MLASSASAQFNIIPPGATVTQIKPVIKPAVGTVPNVAYKPTPKPTPTPTPIVKPDYSKMTLGINVGARSNSGADRYLTNLVGNTVILRTWNSSFAAPEDRKDANGNVVKLLPGEGASRIIATPTAVFNGAKTVTINCRWDGKGTAEVWGSVAKSPKVSTNALTFTFTANGLAGGNIQFKNIDPADPVRNVDCREADADSKAFFNPAYIADLKRYSTVRFMKWQTAVEKNNPVTWADRSTPARLGGSDGVPIEQMVALANLAKVNPWFCIPWNADADYIRRFALYVRDNLDPTLVAYVETSNEVWNSAYKVTAQAIAEGVAEGLHPTDKYTAGTKRYAERSTEVMDIWSAVFAGKMHRIQRLLAGQQGTYGVGQALGFRDTAKHHDVLATAPYFAASPAPGSVTDIDAWFASTLIPKLDSVLRIAVQTKAIATKYGLRYVAYEGGQHVNSSKDVPLLTAINRHPAMGAAYTRYLTKWQAELGDLMVLFADYGAPGKYGAWGLQEYLGQPLDQAPKAKAVDAFVRSHLATPVR
jgi:hypothetical protein